MKITILVLSLVLVGCGGEIDQSDLIKGEEFCSDKLGVMKYLTNYSGDKTVYCKTSESSYLPKYKLKGTKK